MKDAPAIAAKRIIQQFGGPTSLARCLAIAGFYAPASTVRSWEKSGIPVKWQHPVIFAGTKAAVPIGPHDFFEPIREPLTPEAAQ